MKTSSTKKYIYSILGLFLVPYLKPAIVSFINLINLEPSYKDKDSDDSKVLS